MLYSCCDLGARMQFYWSLKQVPELSGLSWLQRQRIFEVCRRRYLFAAPLTRPRLLAYSSTPLIFFASLMLAGPVLNLDDIRGGLLLLAGVSLGWFVFSRTAINQLRPFYIHYLPGKTVAGAS